MDFPRSCRVLPSHPISTLATMENPATHWPRMVSTIPATVAHRSTSDPVCRKCVRGPKSAISPAETKLGFGLKRNQLVCELIVDPQSPFIVVPTRESTVGLGAGADGSTFGCPIDGTYGDLWGPMDTLLGPAGRGWSRTPTQRVDHPIDPWIGLHGLQWAMSFTCTQAGQL